MSVILPSVHAMSGDQTPAGLHPSVFGSPALFGLPGAGHRFPGALGPDTNSSPYSAYAAQAYMSSLASADTAFYSSLGAAENAAEAWRSLSQSAAAAAAAAWSYDPTSLGSYPYGTPYGGLDVRRKNATRESTATLKAWLFEHIKNPYPTKGEKIMLAIITKMTLTQVSTWFANARRRLKKENKMQWSPRNRTGDDDDDDDDDRASNSDGEDGVGDGEKSSLDGTNKLLSDNADWHSSEGDDFLAEKRRHALANDEDIDVDGGVDDSDDLGPPPPKRPRDLSAEGIDRSPSPDDHANRSINRTDNLVSSTSEDALTNAKMADTRNDAARPAPQTSDALNAMPKTGQIVASAEKPRIWSLADVATSPASSSSHQHHRSSTISSLAGSQQQHHQQQQHLTSSSSSSLMSNGRVAAMSPEHSPTLQRAGEGLVTSLASNASHWMKANSYRPPYLTAQQQNNAAAAAAAAAAALGPAASYDYSAAARYYQQLRVAKQIGGGSPFMLASAASTTIAMNKNTSPLTSPISPAPHNSPTNLSTKFPNSLTAENLRANDRIWRS